MEHQDHDIGELFAMKTSGSASRLLSRLKLMTADKVRIGRVAFIIVLVTYIPLGILSAVEGAFWGEAGFAFLVDPSIHLRFLVSVPILLFSAPFIGMMIRVVVVYATQNLLTENDLEEIWKPSTERVRALINSRIVLLVIAVVVLILTAMNLNTLAGIHLKPGQTSWLAQNADGLVVRTNAGWWYVLVSAPIVQIILGRWLWRYGIWCWLLAKLASAKLKCVASHPDRSGGLGILMGTQTSFCVIFFALNLTYAGTLTSQILRGDITFDAGRVDMIIVMAISIFLILVPLFFFVGDLAQTKRQAAIEYGKLGTDLGRAFHHRWVTGENENPPDLYAEIDPSMMTDYNTTYAAVEAMRPVPFGIRDIAAIIVILLVAYTPMFLTKFSFEDLIGRLLAVVT